MSGAGDAFAAVIQDAVEAAIRKALNLSEATNRRLMTVEEAAAYLSLSEREIHNMIALKDLKCVRRGRRVMLDIRDINQWIEENKS